MLRNWILKILLIRRNTLYSYLKIQIYDEEGDLLNTYTLGIDIGSTTVKIAILDENEKLLFADYVILQIFRRHWQIFWKKHMHSWER